MRGFPKGPEAVLAALRLDRGEDAAAPALEDRDWRAALEYCDRSQLTLAFRNRLDLARCPEWVRERLDGNAAANRVRFERMAELYRGIAAAFQSAYVEHLVLKGFAHAPHFTREAALRMQYDLDLYCPKESLGGARRALEGLGFTAMEATEKLPTDHLPAMIRQTGWQWKGDFFDVEIPTSVDLHFRFWDRETERFGPAGLDGFWDRRTWRQVEGLSFWGLEKADSLGYACLHALRHMLRGDTRPGQMYEIARFLAEEKDAAFWERWRELHDGDLRLLEAICFKAAAQWFGCALPDAAAEEVEQLPEATRDWFARFGDAPLESYFRPNKDELWLHLSLLASRGDRAAVLRRRLLPVGFARQAEAPHVPEAQQSWAFRVRMNGRYALRLARRAVLHGRLLAPTVARGAQWGLGRLGLGEGFWRLMTAALFYNSCLFLFYILYNLHLLRLGLREDFLGRMASAMSAGSIAGSVLAGILVWRVGLRATLLGCFGATAVLCGLRTGARDPAMLIGLAFVAGISQSFWAVCLLPSVSQLVSERGRQFAFSVTVASGIGLGVVAGVAAGKLAAWTGSTERVLWMAVGLAIMAMVPLASGKVRLGKGAREGEKAYVLTPFLRRFLAALAVWGLAVGAFNPFFNVYLTRVGYSAERIGTIFSAAQLAQVCALLAAPALLRRFGEARGLALTQWGTGLALAAMASVGPWFAGVAYGAYTSFQYMGEPAMFSLLMGGVATAQQGGASALHFLVLFGVQSAAALASGEVIARWGYGPALYAAAVLAGVAGVLFGRLRRG